MPARIHSNNSTLTIISDFFTGFKRFLCLVVFISITLPAIGAEEDYCRVLNPPFVSCSGAKPNYRSVLLAVHGWNGSCAGTFGSGDESIFQTLDDHRFYDFDCFAYDSKKESLENNVDLLHERLVSLSDKGFRNVMLVTHSTGGIIVLRMLTDAVLDHSDSLREDIGSEPILDARKIRVQALQAWATPINGLRSQINFGGRLARLTGYSPETLGELHPDSEYLEVLKRRLAKMETLYLAPDTPPRIRGAYGSIMVTFYQGQGDDWVVHSIDPDSGSREGWLWSGGRSKVVNTELGHGHNVSETGQVGEPRLTAHVMELETLLRLPFAPRFDDLFKSDWGSVPLSVEERQREVIDALVFYARNQFSSTMLAAMEFLELMMGAPFSGQRSSETDRDLVFGVLQLLEEYSAHPDKQLVEFFIRFVTKVLDRYDPAGGEDFKRFGYNHSDVVKAVLDMVNLIHEAVLLYVPSLPENEQRFLLEPYNSLDEFDTVVQEIIGRFYDSEYRPVHDRSIEVTRHAIARSSNNALKDSPLLSSLNRFYLRNYNNLSPTSKVSIDHALASVAARNETLRRNARDSWSVEVDYRHEKRKLWATLNSDNFAAQMVEFTPVAGAEISDIGFLSGVASRSGASGNNVELAIRAKDRAILAVGAMDRGPERAQVETILMRDAAKANLPAVRMGLERAAHELR